MEIWFTIFKNGERTTKDKVQSSIRNSNWSLKESLTPPPLYLLTILYSANKFKYMLKTGKGISFAVNKDDIEKKSWPNDGMRRSFSIYYHLVISFIEIGDITNHLFEQVISPRSEEYGGFGKTETVSDYKNCFTMSNVYDGVLSLFIMTSVTFSLYTHCSSIFEWCAEDLYSVTILCRDRTRRMF